MVVVVWGRVHLFPPKDQPLLHGRDSLLLLHQLLDLGDLVGALDVELDFLSGEGAYSIPPVSQFIAQARYGGAERTLRASWRLAFVSFH